MRIQYIDNKFPKTLLSPNPLHILQQHSINSPFFVILFSNQFSNGSLLSESNIFYGCKSEPRLIEIDRRHLPDNLQDFNLLDFMENEPQYFY